MRLPYVIDNERHKLADVLGELLHSHAGRSLDVASAYFTVGGFTLLAEGLAKLGSFRLLLGAEPTTGEEVGLRPERRTARGLFARDVADLPFDEKTLREVEALVRYLRREQVEVRLAEQGFLHAKAWVFYGDRPGQRGLFDRFRPLAAVVGSSNFTRPGLTSNRELNLAHQVLLDPEGVGDAEAEAAVGWLAESRASERISAENRQLLKSEVGARAILDLERWFDRQWSEANDFKDELVALLDASKFGTLEYTPYQIYLKALYEYYRDDLTAGELPAVRSAVDLAEFQDDAVRRARTILAVYDGVLVADSVGLGKTWIGLKLLEDFAYHQRQKALVICPAALRESVWQRRLAGATIAAHVLSQEELGRAEFEPGPWKDVDVVLIDECHNFRNPGAQRYQTLERILQGNGGRGTAGARKKIVLLTATPISNDLFDLYHQLQLITGGDRTYFSAAGIGDLERYFRSARRSPHEQAGTALFNLLEEVVIRRTRQFIREAYPQATIQGKAIHFPERVLRSVRYDLESTYGGLYDAIVAAVEGLRLAPYNLETYRKAGQEIDALELGREQALVGIFKSRYLKRLESSVHAFRLSIERALQFLKTFESFLLDGRVLRSTTFHRALQLLEREGEEDSGTPSSQAARMESREEVEGLLAEMEPVEPGLFDLRRLHDAVQADVEALTRVWTIVDRLGSASDAKLARLKDLLRSPELRGRKCLIFTYYLDTARYLYRQIGDADEPVAAAFLQELEHPHVRRLDSGADRTQRLAIVQAFAPRSNEKAEWAGSDREIDVLISTDVLAEGQNLQDCGLLVNYDLHWNPTRMIQRAGRLDRIGSPHERILIHNMFPDEGLERLLGLVERLTGRIEDIDRQGFLDASILGEEVHPRTFNTLRRIAAEDSSVLVEEERLSELVSGETLAQQLKGFLAAHGEEVLRDLPDGIHSGHRRPAARGVFFYFQSRRPGEAKRHYWRYVDLRADRILDNRLLIAQLLACIPETPRVIETDLETLIFELQERAVLDILSSVERQQAVEEAPAVLDSVQQALATAMRDLLSQPGIQRERVVDALRRLRAPLRRTLLRDLAGAYRMFQKDRDGAGLLAQVETYLANVGDETTETREARAQPLRREELRLICFELITG